MAEAFLIAEDNAVETMLSVAAGQTNEAALTPWLVERVRSVDERDRPTA